MHFWPLRGEGAGGGGDWAFGVMGIYSLWRFFGGGSGD